jgi:hypothetical protein
MRHLSTAALVALILAAAGRAQAQAPQPMDPTIHRHMGFYLNMDLGGGYLGSSASAAGIDVKLSGGAGQFSLAVGGAVMENLILAAHLWGYAVASPTVTINSQSVSATNATLGVSGIGLAIVYYVMPTNLYLSLTPSITSLSVEQGGTTYSTENGPGLRAAVGKEWWVSDHWGIGLDGNLAFTSNKDKGPGAPTWGSFAISVAFSATYN